MKYSQIHILKNLQGYVSNTIKQWLELNNLRSRNFWPDVGAALLDYYCFAYFPEDTVQQLLIVGYQKAFSLLRMLCLVVGQVLTS